MKKVIHWPSFLIGFSIAAGLALLVHFLGGLGFWPSLGIGIAAVVVNGIVAAIEDEAPRSFNKPRPGDEQELRK